ncbi:hypothetical protein POM88_022798 [Heracleum sosnowskyi]|uniref:Uncharacterized protein n=1 Tax=Heracleum sosnowskyi TaxID=360622 RepID=A0AAD8IIB4_9APIA|nr:hypothetical protein POM88_022798 [Heracleum sosnowskyi]
MATGSLRCVAFAYITCEKTHVPDNEEELARWNLPEDDLVLLGIVGLKAQKSASNQISTSFTSYGRHIISACDDSNVYFWNCSTQDTSSASQPKTSRSFECFSNDASVAIPWSGLRSGISKSAYNLQSSSKSHAWGLVIVTTCWDGRIRSFHNYGLPVTL